ncbi:hypothetical protein X956_03890 [Trueperella pyogenes TP8]|nr:hypothetical protein X956_03890 [Trueperella pyogenes TP8]
MGGLEQGGICLQLTHGGCQLHLSGLHSRFRLRDFPTSLFQMQVGLLEVDVDPLELGLQAFLFGFLLVLFVDQVAALVGESRCCKNARSQDHRCYCRHQPTHRSS